MVSNQRLFVVRVLFRHVIPVKSFAVQFDIVKKVDRVLYRKRPVCETCSIETIEVHEATHTINYSTIIGLSATDFRKYTLLAHHLNSHTVESRSSILGCANNAHETSYEKILGQKSNTVLC
jgi:hypothetical protein